MFSINLMIDKQEIELQIQEWDGERWQEKLAPVMLPIALVKDLHADLGVAIEKAARKAAA